MSVTILSWGCLGGVCTVQIFGARRSMWMTSFLAPPRLLVPYWAESAPSWFSSLSSAVILTLNAKIARSRATLIPVLLSVSPVFLPNPFRLCLTCLNLKLWLSAYLNTIHFFQTNYFHKYVSISVCKYLSMSVCKYVIISVYYYVKMQFWRRVYGVYMTILLGLVHRTWPLSL